MTEFSLFQNSLKKVYTVYAKDPTKALIHTSTMSWAVSALAQILMIAKNKDIGTKEKTFLIPQEIADSALNVILYYLICTKSKDQIFKLIENGTISVEKVENAIAKLSNGKKDINSHIVKTVDNYLDTLPKEEKNNIKKTDYRSIFLDNAKRELEDYYSKENYNKRPFQKRFFVKTPDEKLLKEISDLKTEFKGIKNGIGIVTALCSSVAASNVVTPVLRNVFANKCQEKYKKEQQAVFQMLNNRPISPIFNSFKI